MSTDKNNAPNHTTPANTKLPGIIKPTFGQPPKLKVTGPGAEPVKQPDAPKPGPTPTK